MFGASRRWECVWGLQVRLRLARSKISLEDSLGHRVRTRPQLDWLHSRPLAYTRFRVPASAYIRPKPNRTEISALSTLCGGSAAQFFRNLRSFAEISGRFGSRGLWLKS